MDVNVIVVEWSGAAYHLYNQLVANIRVVGDITAKYLNPSKHLTSIGPFKFHFCIILGS